MKKTWENIKKIIKTIEGGQQFDRSTKPRAPIANDFNRKTLSVVAFVWIFTIGFYFALFSGIAFFTGKLADPGVTSEPLSLYKPGIDIINNLKGSKYSKYIQRLYVHPKDENKMMIMIKPNYWGAISQEDKNEIILKVLGEWQKLYQNSDPDEHLEPEAHFANNYNNES